MAFVKITKRTTVLCIPETSLLGKDSLNDISKGQCKGFSAAMGCNS
jgi:hypothetical protein